MADPHSPSQDDLNLTTSPGPLSPSSTPPAEQSSPQGRPLSFDPFAPIPPPPPTAPSLPLFQRLRNRSRAYSRRHSVPSSSSRGSQSSSTAKPTFIKTYSSHAHLPVDVYIPPPSVSSPGPLPLYVHIAPTSFLAPTAPSKNRKNIPLLENIICGRLSQTHGICVASVSFRSPPRWMYPTQVFDVSALISDILAGKSLPVDRTRVAIGGVGAGGTVALGAVQTQELRGLVKGVAAIGAVVDFARGVEDKTKPRSSRSGSGVAQGIEENLSPSQLGTGITDAAEEKTDSKERKAAQRDATLRQKLIRNAWGLMAWAYLPPGQDLTESMLSASSAPRSALPPSVFLAAAEEDVLCAGAEALAVRLAAEGAERRAESGTALLNSRDVDQDNVDSERIETHGEDCWESEGVRWEKVKNWQRGFFEAPDRIRTEEEQTQVLELLADQLGAWLWRTAYV